MTLGVEYDVPSTMFTMGMFLFDILIYALLAFYFDHVDESNRGKSYNGLFFLKRSYWMKNNKKEIKNNKLNGSLQRNSLEIEYENEENKESASQKLLEEQINDLTKSGNLKINSY